MSTSSKGIIVRHWRIRRFLEAVRRAAINSLFYSGLLSAWGHLVRRKNSGLLILMYHEIGANHFTPPSLCVSEKHFRRQVKHLARNYQFLSLDEAVEVIERGRQFPKNGVIVTFDDGYRNNYTKALPILSKHGCPATVFVTTEPLEKGKPLWPNSLYFWLTTTQMSELHLPHQMFDNIGGRDRVFSLHTRQQRDTAFYEIVSLVKRVAPEEREGSLRKVARSLGFDPDSALPGEADSMMTWDQLRLLCCSGVMTVGSHTVTHSVLSTLTRQEALRELAESKATLEKHLDRPITLFAYPFGEPREFTDEHQAMVKEAGYRAACSALEGLNFPGTDLFALRRIYVEDDPPALFALKLLRAVKDSRGRDLRDGTVKDHRP